MDAIVEDVFVEFGDLPAAMNRSNTDIYNSISQELRAHPNQWGKCAEVIGEKAVFRWTAAMKKRGFEVSQRKVRDNTWAIWCRYVSDQN